MPLASDKSCLNFGLDYVMLFQVFERIPGFLCYFKTLHFTRSITMIKYIKQHI